MRELQEAGVAFELPEFDLEQFDTLREERAKARAKAQAAERTVDFSVIDAETDRVLRSGRCQFQDLAAQSTAPNEIVVEGRLDDITQAVSFSKGGMSVREASRREIEAHDVNMACRQRILNRYDVPDQLNAPYLGYESDMRQWIEAMLSVCAELKAMQPIPHDYDTDKWWPPAPPKE